MIHWVENLRYPSFYMPMGVGFIRTDQVGYTHTRLGLYYYLRNLQDYLSNIS
jgi:hypothetical protein